MDYEKKIREYLNSSEVDQLYKSMLINLFPELAESEDEKIRKKVVDVLKLNIKGAESQMQASRGVDRTFEVYACNKVIAWLKSLRPQKKQEWSKEDVEMIDWLIRCCESEHKELCNDRYGHQEIVSDLKRDCRKKWDWLESLKDKVVPQKQWKPTEEQIQTLEYYMHALTCNEHKEVLFGLMEQLKAL